MKPYLRPLLSVSLVLATPGLARAQADEVEWTAILLMSATYETMEEKLSWTGSSEDVNVIVLHDHDGQWIEAYRMLPDTNPDNPPGECCPGDSPDCCDSHEIPLEEVGIEPGAFIYDRGVLGNFFNFIAREYPARHYLVSLRGQISGANVLRHNHGGGLTVVELNRYLGQLVRLSGRQIDVVNFGFCHGASTDFAFTLRDNVDYLVASPDYTNPPVGSRWRFYTWVRQLIQQPSMTGRELAVAIPGIFATTSEACLEAGHQCTNTNPPNPQPYGDEDQPWICSTLDLAQIERVAETSRELACTLVDDFVAFETAYAAAMMDASVYGRGYGGEYRRPDLHYFAVQLKQYSVDAGVHDAADDVITAVEDVVIENRRQEAPSSGDGWFGDGDDAYGLSAFLPGGSASLADYERDFGDFQLASMWRLLLEADQGAPQPTMTGLAILPEAIHLTVGESVPVVAAGVSEEYGPMCAVPVEWDVAGLIDVGELEHRGNPTVFRALLAGEGSLTARLSGMAATVEIVVDAAETDRDPATGPATGCGCGASVAPAYLLLVTAVWTRRRRRRPGDQP